MVYFVPTPIGNLDDITCRALKYFATCNTVFCEDTRVAKKLFSLLQERHEGSFGNFDIQNKSFISLHSHNEKSVLQSINKDVFASDVLYLSDAGMPCISDPGMNFVDFCIKNDIEYSVLAGASASLLAFASSGFGSSKFNFYGFLPHKSEARKTELEKIKSNNSPTILYEAPHRIKKLSEELKEVMPNTEVFAIKEATKKFELKIRTTCVELHKKIKEINTKGEWALVLNTTDQTRGDPITCKDILALSLKPKEKAKMLAKLTGKSVEFWYSELQKEVR